MKKRVNLFVGKNACYVQISTISEKNSLDQAYRMPPAEKGWRRPVINHSLPESYGTISIPKNGSFWRKMMAFAGPGLMVAVGYMDPGNWATDIAGRARFGYTLLIVVLASNLFAMLLQHLSLKLGIVTGRDLAQACRDHYSRRWLSSFGCSAKSPSPPATWPK
jgi:hypothetical protein